MYADLRHQGVCGFRRLEESSDFVRRTLQLAQGPQQVLLQFLLAGHGLSAASV